MKVAFIVRSTIYSVRGGDTVQVEACARHLRLLGVTVDVFKADDAIQHSAYDLFHFFNLTRPANFLHHIDKIRQPIVTSPVFIDYSGYDKYARRGAAGLFFRYCSPSGIEYFKTLGRFIKGQEVFQAKKYIWHGQNRSMQIVLSRSSIVTPASNMERTFLQQRFPEACSSHVVRLGVDERIFNYRNPVRKEHDLVLCVGRIEGIKNQLSLIRALNKTRYRLMIIGSPAPNHAGYYRRCVREAASNVSFHPYLPHRELVGWYQRAEVHVLPSYFENCGLATLEAAAMGCKVVASRNGFISEYLNEDAFYCDPASPQTIAEAVEMAVHSSGENLLAEKIRNQYTWRHTAYETLCAYQKILGRAVN